MSGGSSHEQVDTMRSSYFGYCDKKGGVPMQDKIMHYSDWNRVGENSPHGLTTQCSHFERLLCAMCQHGFMQRSFFVAGISLDISGFKTSR